MTVPDPSVVTLEAVNDQWKGSGHYVARITGRDARMTFARDFQGPTALITEPGLFEVQHIDKKGRKDRRYRLVAQDAGKLVRLPITDVEAAKLAKGLDEGRTIEEMTRVTNEVVWRILLSADKLGTVDYATEAEAQAEAEKWHYAGVKRWVKLGYEFVPAREAAKLSQAKGEFEAVEAACELLGTLDRAQVRRVLAEVGKRLAPRVSHKAGTGTDDASPASESV